MIYTNNTIKNKDIRNLCDKTKIHQIKNIKEILQIHEANIQNILYTKYYYHI